MLLKKFLLGCLLIPLCLCAGCWDVDEINHRAASNVLYFDLGREEKLQMGIDLHVDGTLQPPINDMGQQFVKNHGVILAEGKSSVEAWSKLQAMTSRNIYLGQLRAIVLSDEYAKQDITDSLDFIGRLPSIPGNIDLLITKENPKELLDLKNRSNYIPGNYIDQHFESTFTKTLTKPVRLFEIFSRTDNKTADPYFPLISTSQENYFISGTAVFSGKRMVGELDQQETYAFTLLGGGTTGLLTVPAGENETVSYLQLNSRSKIHPKINPDGSIAFDVNVKAQSMTVETNPSRGEIGLEDKKRLDLMAGNYLQGEIEKLLVKLQQLNSDPVGFGEKFRSKYPDRWEQIDWRQAFPQAQFNVEVEFNTQNTGVFR